MTRTPEQLRYASSHEWVDVQGDTATIGISAFAVAELTDLVFMALPEAGRTIIAGDEFGEVESVKAVSPLYAPISGQIIEVHAALADNLELLSEDPYEKGWIIRVKLNDAAEVNNLLTYDAYKAQCESH